MSVLNRILGSVENKFKGPEKIKGRRAFIFLSLIALVSACTPSKGVETTTPTPRQSFVQPTREIILPRRFSRELVTNVTLSANGEPLFEKNPSRLPTPVHVDFTEKTPVKKTSFKLPNGSNVAIFEVGSIDKREYPQIVTRAFSQTQVIVREWFSKANLNVEPKIVPGNIAITINNVSASNKDGKKLWILADYENTDAKSILDSAKSRDEKAFVTEMLPGQTAFVLTSINPNKSNKIGINLVMHPYADAITKANGINITDEQSLELSLVNEFATFFLQFYMRNSVPMFNALLSQLKSTYDFPPTNNSEFIRQMDILRNSNLNASRTNPSETNVADPVQEVSIEAFSTAIEFDYLKKYILKK
jgi:hypothetical protein